MIRRRVTVVAIALQLHCNRWSIWWNISHWLVFAPMKLIDNDSLLLSFLFSFSSTSFLLFACVVFDCCRSVGSSLTFALITATEISHPRESSFVFHRRCPEWNAHVPMMDLHHHLRRNDRKLPRRHWRHRQQRQQWWCHRSSTKLPLHRRIDWRRLLLVRESLRSDEFIFRLRRFSPICFELINEAFVSRCGHSFWSAKHCVVRNVHASVFFLFLVTNVFKEQ